MRVTLVTFDWADGEYGFDLPLRQVEQLEEETGFGIAMLLHRLQTGQHKSREPRLAILYGLIGAGMEPPRARALVRTWVDDRPGKEREIPAAVILKAWLVGVPHPGVAPGKPPAPETGNGTPPPTAVSTSAPSTAPAPRSASRRAKSGK